MKKVNCWEFEKCGREEGGSNVAALGVCAATLPSNYDALNGGVRAGRFCWKVAGTLCGGIIQGTFADKLLSCVACDFFRQVKKEEGPNWKA